MNINEVEKLLSVSRANIRFYEKEGLISPERKKNNYRDYSDADVLQLKKILVFRKLGFTIEEISKMQNGELQLDNALSENIKRLETAIEDLKGSLEIARKIEKEQVDFLSIDEDAYWNIITEEERSGKKFADIFKDYLSMELFVFDTMWKWVFFHDFKKSRRRNGVLVACCILLLICIIRGLSKQFIGDGSFWEGFLYPFLLFICCSLLMLPIFLMARKSPKAAEKVASVMAIIGITFFAVLTLFIIVLILNSIFHFWF